jgi:hypothetical protein
MAWHSCRRAQTDRLVPRYNENNLHRSGHIIGPGKPT